MKALKHAAKPAVLSLGGRCFVLARLRRRVFYAPFWLCKPAGVHSLLSEPVIVELDSGPIGGFD